MSVAHLCVCQFLRTRQKASAPTSCPIPSGAGKGPDVGCSDGDCSDESTAVPVDDKTLTELSVDPSEAAKSVMLDDAVCPEGLSELHLTDIALDGATADDLVDKDTSELMEMSVLPWMKSSGPDLGKIYAPEDKWVQHVT